MKTPGIILVLLMTVFTGMLSALESPALDMPDPDMTAPDAIVTSAEITDVSGKDPSAPAAAIPMLSTNLGGLTVSVASPNGKQGMSRVMRIRALASAIPTRLNLVKR